MSKKQGVAESPLLQKDLIHYKEGHKPITHIF